MVSSNLQSVIENHDREKEARSKDRYRRTKSSKEDDGKDQNGERTVYGGRSKDVGIYKHREEAGFGLRLLWV